MINEIKTFEERKEEIIEKGRKTGFITYEELANYLKGIELESEQLDDLYDAFVKNGIEIITEEEIAGSEEEVDGGEDIEDILKDTTIAKELINLGNETIEISKGNFDDNFGTDRMFGWKETIKIIPNYWLTGVGIDNFYYAFNGKPLTINNGIFGYDKVHNEYLQVFITQGVLSFITYILLFANIVFVGIKESYKNDKLYLLLPVGGYMIQAFFNISVIDVAPLFYIGLGLLYDRKSIKY